MFPGAPRKKSSMKQQAVADLLVFGYACKVFRDDEKALYHEQGRHLIPWMGDNNILIDRYDGRGHLHDLSEYDAEHNSWNRNYNISEEEARIEALCDEERYLALHTDLLEEEARQEEEYKRLSEALAEDGTYNSVCFQYLSDYYDPSQPTEEEEPQKDEKDSSDLEDNEEPFIAPEGMNVPSDVELPATAKMHAIIERTANFVCKQGAQFEIMLKAKQARNSQFDFLRFDHYLNPYYKHILRAMKEGRYTMLAEKTNEEQKKTVVSTDKVEDSDDDDDDEGGDYLHPSLFASKRCSRLEELTKPLKVIDPDHPLAALVRKAQNEKMASQLAANVAPAPPPATQTESTTETTVASAYYNYYMLPDGTYCFAPPPPGMDASACYSSIPAGENATKEAAISPQSTILPPLSSGDDSNKVPAGLSATSTLAPVVAIIPPPPDIQPVIDKLAQYVARNGIKFETSVQAKNDSRFDFLQPWHQYNPYYEFKKQFFMQKEGILLSQPYTSPDDNSISTESLNDAVMQNDTVDDETNACEASSAKDDASSSNKAACDGKLKVSFAPISFAIRVKETDLLPFEKNRVKLDDDSEEEGEGDGKDGQQNKTSSSSNCQALNTATIVVEEKKPQLTPEELEAKQAKQKLEDRLAAAAREKLAQAAKESKEKQLQAERKRKAALFLQTLKNPLEVESGRTEESSYSQEVGSTMNYGLLPEDIIVPTTEYPITARSPTQEYSRAEREKKKKKRKKRSRSRSHSPKIHYDSKSRSHSKVKHSLPTAYRTVRRSRQAGKDLDHVTAVYQLGKRSRSRSPRKVSQSSERRREDDRTVSCSYRVGYTPGNSRKRSRSPHENRKKKHSRSESKSKAKAGSHSPSRHGTHSSTHSTSISPVESRGSSQERYRENAQDKDGHITSEIVSSVQTKITQDLMAKVRAMLAASKNMHSSAS